MINSVSISNISASFGNIDCYITKGVSAEFQENIFNDIKDLSEFSPKVKKALSKLKNIIILENSNSEIPSIFSKTKTKLDKYASDAYGFVSKRDKAIVLNEQNHKRKDASLEGCVSSQASDTLSHEIGHLIDKKYSTSHKFREAYFKDLKEIEKKLQQGDAKIGNRSLSKMLEYLKHYMEGADFSDGINKKDITREGLRENFAECFSVIADKNPTEINGIYASLFPNTMRATLDFVV